ncbi:MAG: hypothetical protein ACPGTP_01000, partial [Bacteroidia bacterium]
MKKINPYKITILALFLLAYTNVYSQFKDEKEYHKAVKFIPNGKISVQNKHGDIRIISWDKDSVVVRATISGESKSLSKLNEQMSQTRIDFRQESGRIQMNTATSTSSINKGINDIKTAAGINSELKVYYEVRVPKGSHLALSNKYGDIYLDEHNGPINLEISHGNLRANSLKKVKYLKSNFGNIYIDHVHELKGNLLFSELDLSSARKVMISSKSTDFELGEIEDLQLSSNNDKVDLDKVAVLKISGNLSKVNVYRLKKSGSIDLKYGRLKIKKIESSVCSFNAKSTRTTFDLGFDSNMEFEVEGMIDDSQF